MLTTGPATVTPWLIGVAQIVRTHEAKVIVDCPHCGEQHEHGRGMIGSRQVIAGCHTGWSRCRLYAIPEPDQHRPRTSGNRYNPFTEKARPAA